MNVKKIVGLLVIVAVAIGLFAFNYSTGQNASSTQGSTVSASEGRATGPADLTNKDKKVLIVFFSRTKGLYGNETPVIGNTHQIANYIQAATGGDIYEIVPAKDYPDEYNTILDVAKAEQANNKRPAIKNPLPDVSSYDIVFVGGPIWWGEYPMIVRSFLDQANLNGKTVIPFTTHEGSGLGNTKAQLEAQYPNATVLKGLAIRGRQAALEESKAEVDVWLKEIGII